MREFPGLLRFPANLAAGEEYSAVRSREGFLRNFERAIFPLFRIARARNTSKEFRQSARNNLPE